MDVANPSELKVIPRVAITTTTGAVQLWQQEQFLWNREEGLANIVLTELVELPEQQVVASHIDLENETFGARLQRQLADAQVPRILATVTVNRLNALSRISPRTSPIS